MDEYKEYTSKIVEKKFDMKILLDQLDEACIEKKEEAKKRVDRKTKEMREMEKKELKELDERLNLEPAFMDTFIYGLPIMIFNFSEPIIDKHIRDNKKWVWLLARGLCGLIIGIALFLSIAAWGEVMGPEAEITDGIYPIPCLIISMILILSNLPGFAKSAYLVNKNRFISENRARLTEDKYYELQEEYGRFIAKHDFPVKCALVLIALSIVPVVALRMRADLYPELELERYGGYAVCIMLAILGISTMILVNYGLMKDCYERILFGTILYRKYTLPKYYQILYLVTLVLWGLAVIVFLTWGLVFHTWQSCWLSFMIFGVLYGACAGAYTVILECNNYC